MVLELLFWSSASTVAFAAAIFLVAELQCLAKGRGGGEQKVRQKLSVTPHSAESRAVCMRLKTLDHLMRPPTVSAFHLHA